MSSQQTRARRITRSPVDISTNPAWRHLESKRVVVTRVAPISSPKRHGSNGRATEKHRCNANPSDSPTAPAACSRCSSVNVIDPQQLQGPFVHRIHPSSSLLTPSRRNRGPSVSTQAPSPHKRSSEDDHRIAESQGHALGFLQGTHAADPSNTSNTVARSWPDGSNRTVCWRGIDRGATVSSGKTESRSRHGLTRMRFVRNSIGIGSIMQVIRNKSLTCCCFRCNPHQAR